MNKEKIKQLVKEFLVAIGEDPEREGLLDTPARVAEMCGELFSPPSVKNEYTAFAAEGCGGMVLVKEIDFSSVCEHHLMPFFGKAHIAYIPNKKIIGLSKLARIVDKNARKLQIQERLTRQIAQEIEAAIAPKGVAVYIQAAHTCMICRGVKQPSTQTVTTYFSGEMAKEGTKAEFLTGIRI